MGIVALHPSLIAWFRRAHLRTQLLLVVNIAIAVVFAAMIIVDDHHAVQSHIRDKRIALTEEARTIAMAVRSIRNNGPGSVQEFIDATCSTMNARESPGHTIQVILGDTRLVADPHTHGHDHASDSSAVIWGESEVAGQSVRVGERKAPVLADVARAEVRRVSAILLAGAVGAAVLNLLMLRLVTRPIEYMVDAVNRIGRGGLGTTVSIDANRELGDLAEAVSRMSLELALRDADRRAQLHRARRLQSHLIPSPSPHNGLRIAIEFNPADEIAGDFVDVITCPNGDTLLCVADVVGHGIHAAMGSAMLKALLLAAHRTETSPAKILSEINERYWAASLPEDFATMILVRISGKTGHAVYASAGHEAGFIRDRSGRCKVVSSTGLVLGLDPQAAYEEAAFTLNPGDLLVLLSDGVTEAQDEQGSILGRTRVAELIGGMSDPDAASLARLLVDTADRHRSMGVQRDDMTVLAVELSRIDADAHKGELGEPARQEAWKAGAEGDALERPCFRQQTNKQ